MKDRKSKISVKEYYERYAEADRLLSGLGRLEFERTKMILKKFLPLPPAVIIDIGGGTGPYSLWLADLGYDTHLVEPSKKLIREAQKSSREKTGNTIASLTIGDARYLNFPEGCADALLLFGPLYHLTEKKERGRSLSEAYRVLKDNGLMFAAAISRFASALEGFIHGLMKDLIFFEVVMQDLKDGQHRNPTGDINYFTDAFFHLPSELRVEIEGAGFGIEQIFPVEGIAAFISNFEELWSDEKQRKNLLEIIETSERDERILGATLHLLCVARKKIDIK